MIPNYMHILFVGGGTLGSVTPLLAVAEELHRQSQISNLKFQISFWGTRSGPERVLVAAYKIPFVTIPSGKFRRYWDVQNVSDSFIIFWAFLVSCVRFLRQRPSIVVGAGAFVQVPVMWAAACFRIPIVIHQQDVRPGLANRLVAPFASAITTTFRESARVFGQRVEVIGNPVRRAMLDMRMRDPYAARQHFGLPANVPVVLVVGGGTGAQQINTLVQASLPALTARAFVLHVTGRGKAIDVSGYSATVQARYRQFEILTDAMPAAYVAADIIVSRAGMGTITELVALGKPALLIPMFGTHQEGNAAAMVDRGAMLAWRGQYLLPAEISEQILTLLGDPTQRAALARRCAQAFPTDAAGKIAEIVLQVVRG